MKSLEEIKASVPFTRCLGGNTYGTELTLAGQTGSVVFTVGEEWEHVSFAPYSGKCPRWEAMCELKDTFWKDDEKAIQIHPKKSEYVNLKDNCLHLWWNKNIVLPK